MHTTGSDRFTGTPTGTAVPAADFAYAYDPIGNRSDYTPGTETATTYTANELNQYTRTHVPTSQPAMQSYEYDADGNLANTWFSGDMNCDGVSDFGDFDAFATALVGRAAYEAAYPGCHWLNGDLDGDGNVTFDDISGFSSIISRDYSPACSA